jgi:hypothetical protein
MHRESRTQLGDFYTDEAAVKCAEHARPGNFPIGSLESRAAARAIFAERVLDDTVVDMSGLPALFPTPLAEYVDRGDYIEHEVIRINNGKRTIFRRVIRKDSEEYKKSVERGHD